MNDEDESIPMFRKVGDVVDFPYRDAMRRGTVVSVKDSITCLIEAEDEVDGGLFFEKGDDITYLPIGAACPHCGGFAFQCQSDCPAKKRKPRKANNTKTDMSKVTLADIIAMEPGGFINDSFDAVWVSEPAVSQKKEVYYKVKLVSPTNSKISIAAKIWGEVDHKELNGKLVEFGGKGLQRSEYKSEKSPKAIQQVTINVTAKDGSPNDNFRIIGESAHPDKPLPFQGPQQRTDLPERSTGVSGASGAPSPSGVWADEEISRSTVGERVYDYFRVMGTVINAHKKLKDELGLPEFSPTDIKEITTGICMSYKGRYGVFMAPVFSDASPVSSEPKPASVEVPDETGWDDVEKEIKAGNTKQPSKKIESSWKSFIHPRRNVALGSMKDDELVAIARWAVSVNGMEMTGDVAKFHQAAMFMAAEKDWVEPEKCLMASFVMHPEYEKGFSDDDVEAVSQKMFKTSINDLADTEGAVIGLLKSKEFDAFIKECIEHKASSEIPY